MFSPDQLQEYLLCANSPAEFAERCAIQTPRSKNAELFLYPHQEDFLQHIDAHRFTLTLSSRQMGISTALACYLLWAATMKFDQTILLVMPTLVLATDLLDVIRFAYENLPPHLKVGMTVNNRKTISFENGSEIIAAVAGSTTGKGRTLSHLVIDQAGWIMPVFKEMWTNLYPVVASSPTSKVIMTHNGDARGFFGELWHDAPQNGFIKLTIPWWAHPERDQAWADFMRIQIGDIAFNREFSAASGSP